MDINRDHWAAGRHNPLLLDQAGLKSLLSGYGLEIKTTVGWNPLPSLVWFLPGPLKRKLAAKNHRYKYFFIPSLILARIPGLPGFLERLGRTRLFRPKAKSFVARAELKNSERKRVT